MGEIPVRTPKVGRFYGTVMAVNAKHCTGFSVGVVLEHKTWLP